MVVSDFLLQSSKSPLSRNSFAIRYYLLLDNNFMYFLPSPRHISVESRPSERFAIYPDYNSFSALPYVCSARIPCRVISIKPLHQLQTNTNSQNPINHGKTNSFCRASVLFLPKPKEPSSPFMIYSVGKEVGLVVIYAWEGWRLHRFLSPQLWISLSPYFQTFCSLRALGFYNAVLIAQSLQTDCGKAISAYRSFIT